MKRNSTIDVMRTLALTLIIVAHLSAIPNFITEIRIFDVIAMVFLAGASYCISREKNDDEKYSEYICKRFKKLLIPTWKILTIIFLSMLLITNSLKPWGGIRIIQSYLLYDGIGYVWFVRVTLMLAVVSPLFIRIKKWMNDSSLKFYGVFLTWVLLYILIVCVHNITLGRIPRVLSLILYLFPIFLIGYSFVYYLGMVYGELRTKDKIVVCCLSGVIYMLCLFFSEISIIEDKYPPGIMYLSYGVLVTCLMYSFLEKIYKNKSCSKLVIYISKNSFTLYLLHIIPLLIIKYSSSDIVNYLKANPIIEYIFIIILTGILMCINQLIKMKIRRK